MATLSADVTAQMAKWADSQVKKGLYKSRSELVRELFRDRMMPERYSAWSQKVLEKIWDDGSDEIWESYL